MIHKNTITFLKKLRQNNNRDWFEKNKHSYLDAKANVEAVLQGFIDELAKTEKGLAGLEAKKCMFRIYRDIRFSRDKRPYKNNMGASINAGGKKVHDVPGYYVHFEPGSSFIAGGIWQPEPPKLAAIRQEIDYNDKEFLGILKHKDFRKYFGSLSDEDKLSTAPKGYEKTHPHIELLKLKSYIVVHDFTDKDITSPSFVKKAVAVAKAMRPLNAFLKRAMD